MKLVGFVSLAVPLLASEGGSDIIPRTVNFLIFAAILYYLLADPIKNFFQKRAQGIAQQLEEVQARLKAARQERERAEEELQKAKALAREIEDVTEREIEVLVKHIKEQAQEEIAALEKSFNENLELERRKRIRAITKEVLEELFADRELTLDKDRFISLIVKKVA
ncbi:MAG: F0F1 ATP synthase subunit B [Nitratiruptor sp.]|jgi:F-type H+-transporting ATPase subunit b|nr:F0F1 ATP synthase subunit B [Nitratiruptor sp.]NPA84005.1 F0F1 ATP synthase subunit B [Campylobacterota bacterium]